MRRHSMQRAALAVITAMYAFCGLGQIAQSQLLLYEPFDYAAGTTLGGEQTGSTPTAPIGYTNASSGTVWSAHQVGAGYNSVNDALLTAGSLGYGSLATSGNSVTHGSGAAGASSKYADAINLPTPIDKPTDGSALSVYMSFLVRFNSFVQSDGANPSGRFGFAEFSANPITPNGLTLSSDAQNSTTTRMPGTVWVRPDITAGGTPFTDMQLGAGKSNADGISAAGSATWQQDALPAATAGSTRQGATTKVPWSGQTYFIVMKYTFNDPAFDALAGGTKQGQDDSVSIYVNPLNADLGNNAGEASAAASALYSATGGVGSATFDSFGISSFVLLGHRQSGSVAESSAAYAFDELRIGMTWADVTPTAASLLGDFNSDGKVDAGDYATWRKNNNTNNALANDNGLGTPVGANHYALWRANFGNPPGSGSGVLGEGGAVPEPSSALLLILSSVALCGRRATR